jgi:hypothetical protein
VRTKWQITQLAFAAVVVGVTVFNVIISLHDDFPLGPATLCMFTWLIVPAAWIITWAIRRSYYGPPDTSDIAEMLIRQSTDVSRRPSKPDELNRRRDQP